MSKTYHEIASDSELWDEYADPQATTPFSSITYDERMAFLVECFGEEPKGTYLFWTDSGDEDDIEAATLAEAAEIASRRISVAAWKDGAWGIVKDAGTDEQMDVPSRG